MEKQINMEDLKVVSVSLFSLGSSIIMDGQLILNYGIAVLTIVYLSLRIREIKQNEKKGNKDKN